MDEQAERRDPKKEILALSARKREDSTEMRVRDEETRNSSVKEFPSNEEDRRVKKRRSASRTQ